MNEQERIFITQYINDPGFKIKEDVMESELSRLTESNFEGLSGEIEHKERLSEFVKKANEIIQKPSYKPANHIKVDWLENSDKGNKPITDIIPTEDLENLEKHVAYNIRCTYGSIEHDVDGNKIIKDIKITGIDINDVKYD